jgi:enoyl-CoA hydratase
MSFHTLEHLETLIVDRQGAVVTLTLNRPEVRNALDGRTLDDLRRAMLAMKHDEGVRAVVLTGAGSKAFAAGADIREIAGLTPDAARDFALRGQHVFDLIEGLGKPVVAAINGYALGGGCELAMACTIRLAADTAVLGQPEIDLGLIPGYGGTQRLPRLIGSGRALELLLTGARVSAAEAHRLGLVNEVVPAADLMSRAAALAATLASKPPLAAKYILDAVHRGMGMPMSEAQRLEAVLFGLVSSSEDMREGTTAFLEKRQPAFKGR